MIHQHSTLVYRPLLLPLFPMLHSPHILTPYLNLFFSTTIPTFLKLFTFFDRYFHCRVIFPFVRTYIPSQYFHPLTLIPFYMTRYPIMSTSFSLLQNHIVCANIIGSTFHQYERRVSIAVSTPAWHAVVRVWSPDQACCIMCKNLALRGRVSLVVRGSSVVGAPLRNLSNSV